MNEDEFNPEEVNENELEAANMHEVGGEGEEGETDMTNEEVEEDEEEEEDDEEGIE